jgi:formate dehydrogenase subunit delta
MDSDRLVKMANQIGDFFAAMPDRQEALDGIATHIRKFWEPRMRRQIYRHLDEAQGEGLHPIVLEALKAQRAALEPVAA